MTKKAFLYTINSRIRDFNNLLITRQPVLKQMIISKMVIRQLPNIMSFLRLGLIAPFLMTLYSHNYPYAFYIFLTAGLTDCVDGWLARQLACQTHIGRVIDPLADKCLISCGVISLALLQQLPLWLVTLIFLRDLTISLGALIWYCFIERTLNFPPSKLSKINTALQITLIGVCLINLAFTPLPSYFLPMCIFLTATTTAVTYFDYVWTWGQKACALKRSPILN